MTRAADHDRARELAAARPDGFLTAAESAWLDAHLAGCASCAAIAAELDAQRGLFAAARGVYPTPPRDLWARTSAAIEADGRVRARPGRSRRTGPIRLGGWSLAPIAGVVVIAIAVGAGLLSGLPRPGTTGVGGPDATPFPLEAGVVRVLSHGVDGSLELRRQVVSEVCPVAASTCTVSPMSEVTQTERLAAASAWDAIISPSNDQLVVVEKGDGARGVYVVPLRDTTATSTPKPAHTSPATTTPPATATPAGTASPDATPSAEVTPAPTEAPESAPPSEPAAASKSPEAQPSPTIEVTPRTDGAIEIASDVRIVGNNAAYSADGRRFAFSAAPADGSTGPDVYVWRAGDGKAVAITDDQASLFAGWLGKDLLVSRLEKDGPRTYVVGLDGSQALAHDGTMWRPTVSPDGRTAVWWDGSVKDSADGQVWVPGGGSLVLESWPDGGTRQVLAEDGITDWEVRWDDTGTVLAIWTTTDSPGKPGTLSLYAVDPKTGRADLKHPRLDAEPAFDGFSLRTGRLTWSAPSDDDTTVQVLAWSGDKVGRIRILTSDGTTVVR